MTAAPTAVQGQAQPSLTLEAALARALESNPTILAAKRARPVALAGVDVARERPNPEVTFEAARETPKQAITGSVPIELGGKRRLRIDLARASLAVSDADLDRTVAEVTTEVRRAYFELVAANERTRLAGEVRDLAARARDTASARVQVGDAPRLDEIQTELALADAENDLANARSEIVAAGAELNVLLGNPADAPLSLADSLTADAGWLLTDALARANRGNVELVAADRRIAEQAARRNLAQAMRTPDLTAGASFTYDAQPEFSYGWRASVGVTMPVFTSHRAGFLLEEAELARLRAERTALAARVEGAVTAAAARVDAARAQLARYQQDVLPRAADVERLSQELYAAGQTGLAALLQALQSTRDIRRRSVEAGLSLQRALADLERAIGAPIK